MSHEEKTVLRSAITAFFIAFAKVLGFFAALVPAFLILGSLSSLREDSIEKTFDITVRPNAEGKRSAFQKQDTILEIGIEGFIGTGKLTQEKIRELLVEAQEGSLKGGYVKAILLHVNTPGGTVNDSDGIYRLLKEFKETNQIPIYAYVEGLCASGGMYIVSAADKIYASNTSLIGSIGVLLPTFVNVSEPLKNFGIQTVTIAEGKGKDQMNPLRPWKEGEADNLKMVTSYYYDQFLDIVSAARPQLTKERLSKELGARVFPASVAMDYGYIDVAGASRGDAIRALAEEANIEADYQVITLDKENWLQELFQSNALFRTGRVEHHLTIPGTLPQELQNQFLYFGL